MNQHDQLNLQFTYIAHQLIQLCFKKKDKYKILIMAIQLLNKSYITAETWYVAYFLSTSGQEKTFFRLYVCENRQNIALTTDF